MSKWVEVTLKSVNTYLVEIEDHEPEENASDVVIDQIDYDWDEIDQCEVEPDEVEMVMRHIDKDKVLKL